MASISDLEKCPTCGNETSIRAESCPSCGEPLSEGWAQKEQTSSPPSPQEKPEKQKKPRRGLLVTALAILIITFFALAGDDDLDADLKHTDPVAFANKIKELEEAVAKVPASDFQKNIDLYLKLTTLDPENPKYQEKLTLYRSKKTEAEKQEKRREAEKRAAAEAEERRKGFHCLSKWDGAHNAVERYVKDRMRDPDSFEHIETRIAPVNAKGTHALMMSYRARNGFGGMTVGLATATVRNSDCSATIVSLE